MAETLETIRAKMQTWLDANATRLPDAVANTCINIIQRELCRKHDLRFGEISDTFATAIGLNYYALPSGWSRPLRLWYVNPTNNAIVDIEQVDKEVFDRLHPDATKQGPPTHYVVWGNLLFVGQTPDSVYTVHRDYYRLLPDLADGDPDNSNQFTLDAWETLFWGALVEATAFGFEDARIPYWEGKYRASERDLIAEHRRAKTSGRVAQSQEPG